MNWKDKVGEFLDKLAEVLGLVPVPVPIPIDKNSQKGKRK